jgi:hypothetical protein
MATWRLIKPNFMLSLMLRGAINTGESVELWKGSDLVDGQPAGTSSISVQDTINHPQLPRVLGAPHPEIPNCVILDKKLVKGPWRNQCIVAVVYGPPQDVSWGGAPRIWGKPSVEAVGLEIPVYRLIATVPPGQLLYENQGWTIQRAKPHRRRPQIVSSSPNVAADQIEPNIGKLYTFGGGSIPGSGTPYVLGGYAFVEVRSNLYVYYDFWTLAPVNGIVGSGPAGTPTQVEVPPLGYLQIYRTTQLATGVPVVSAFTPAYLPGDPLP